MSKKLINGKLVDLTQEELAQREIDLEAAKIKPFKELQRPAFLFMASKIGLDENAILALISSMPEETEEQRDAKLLAEFVFKNQQAFERDNELLKSLIAISPVTNEQVDAAWRIGEQISW
jgi:hypothetical protein